MLPRFWALFGSMMLITVGLSLVLAYVVARRTLGSTAGTRRFLAVLPLMLGLLVAGALLGVLLGSNGRTSGFVVFQYRFVLVFGVLVGYMLYRTRQAGPLLLDLGRPRPQRFLLVIGVLQLVLAGVQAVLAFSDGNFTGEDLARIVFQAAMGGWFIFQGTRRTQLREHGWVASGDLIRWHKITGYRWEADRPNTLTLQVDTKMAFVRRPSLPIPPEQHDAVDRILVQHVGRASMPRHA